VVELRPAETSDPEIRFETGPGIQTQGDWTDCGVWPLGDGSVALYGFAAILGYSRMLAAIVRCVDDLGGASAEFLTDRDTALMHGSRADGSPIFASDWVDTAALLGTRPRACRPYRAKTKGKVERVIREVKEDFLAWLTGQVFPEWPTLAWYDAMARRWTTEVVAARRHRTTGRVVNIKGQSYRMRAHVPSPDSAREGAAMLG
jgi:transposase